MYLGVGPVSFLFQFINVQAVRRVGLTRTQARIEAEQGRAVRAEDRILAAHLQVDVRVILRRRNTDALELPHSDPDFTHGAIVLELGIAVTRHGASLPSLDDTDLCEPDRFQKLSSELYE